MIDVRDTVSDVPPREWHTQDRPPSLGSRDLHVWSLQIDRQQEQILVSALSPYEVKRAEKFRRPEDRANFVVCRGVLRRLLGEYLGIEPDHVQISYTRDGKPFVDHRSTSLNFNISHSHQYALFAFGNDIELGIDIERIDAIVIDSGMLSHCLHTNEIAMYRALAVEERAQFFFNCWTGKEAYLKLRGDGFAASPYEIDLGPIRENELYSGEIGVHFSQLPSIDGYAAVVATMDRPQRISCYKLGSSLFK